jgi:lipopolysaccharide/colanic/teichoic acid biosynthesis glycosyltransferase
MERFFDFLFSSLSLIILAPFFLFIILILALTGENRIFFLQNRIGKMGKPFKLFKFATMLKDSPNIGNKTLTVKDDPRILPVGKFLRKTKINELPQLINVLFGDMSLIGPRPLTKEAFASYSLLTQENIKKVRPGLSGLGSIIFRNEEDILAGEKAKKSFYDEEIAPYKGQIEEWFVINKNLYVYFLAIFVTIWICINPKSKIVWKAFPNLPKPSHILMTLL